MSLRDIAEDLEISINFTVESIQHATSTEDLGAQCNAVSDQYQALAICELLVDGDVDAFQHHLVRSGQSRRHMLGVRRKEGNTVDPAIRASVVAPFFAALAGHHKSLAQEIAALSPRAWFRDDEYEDDYLYARFLYDLIENNHADAELAATLDAFEASLEGGTNRRLPVCRALLARDQAAFDDSFAALLAARQAEIKAAKKTFESEELTFAPRSRVFVEALALLELADGRGLTTGPEYLPLCPSLARLKASQPFDQGYFPGQPL